MKNFFITGTDTNVGKTLSSAILTLALDATYWKPIQSGSSDRDEVQTLTGLNNQYFHPSC
jgi:dethiobiotin synthetase